MPNTTDQVNALLAPWRDVDLEDRASGAGLPRCIKGRRLGDYESSSRHSHLTPPAHLAIIFNTLTDPRSDQHRKSTVSVMPIGMANLHIHDDAARGRGGGASGP